MVFQGAAEKKEDDDLLTDCSSWFRKAAENIELQSDEEPLMSGSVMQMVGLIATWS